MQTTCVLQMRKRRRNCFPSWGTFPISSNKLFPNTRSPKSYKASATTMSMTGNYNNIPSTMIVQHFCLHNEKYSTYAVHIL